MKRLRFPVTLILSLIPLSACTNTSETTRQEKEQYEWRIESKLSELDDKILSLKAEAETAGADLLPEMETKMAELRQKKEDLEKSLLQLEGATEDSWQALKMEIEGHLANVQEFLSREFPDDLNPSDG